MTLHRGVQPLKPGDTLFVREGTYAEYFAGDGDIPSGAAPSNGIPAKPVTISAYPGEVVTIRPNPGPYTDSVFYFTGEQYIILNALILDGVNVNHDTVKVTVSSRTGIADNITIQNSEIENAADQGILTSDGANYNKFINDRVHDNGFRTALHTLPLSHYHGFYISTDHNFVQGCNVYNNTGYGIQVYDDSYTTNNPTAHDNQVIGNLIHNNAVGGISAGGLILSSGANNKAYDNIIYNCPFYGISVDYNATNTQLVNNTVFGCGEYGIYIGSGSTNAVVENNLAYKNTWGDFENDGSMATTLITNSFNRDPIFANPVNFDFHLTASSPQVVRTGATDDSANNPTDFSGTPWPGQGSDSIGALQYSSKYNLNVVVNGAGLGAVTGVGEPINCGLGAGGCNITVNSGTPVSLMAVSASGSSFSNWTIVGSSTSCPGTVSACTFTVIGNTTVTASFAANTAPSITKQPVNQTVSAGQAATFNVAATGIPAPTYQWQENGVNIAGATGSSYTTLPTATSDSGSSFDVVVSNTAGNATSNAATLTVNVAPSITTQPVNQTVISGQTATFSIAASGTAPLSYQWQENGVNIAGAISSSYTTPATVTADNGSAFAVVVSNSAGSITSSTADLTVNVFYTLAVNAGNGGTVALSLLQLSNGYPAGTVVTLTSTPAVGYQFTSWSGGASGSSNPLNVTMNANLTITASFSQVSSPNPNIFYVATNGSDSNNGSISNPFRTITHGLSALKPGYSLYLKGGSYAENLSNFPSGNSSNPINILAYNGEAVTIVPSSSSSPVMLFSGQQYFNVSGLTVNAINVKADAIDLAKTTSNIILNNMTVENSLYNDIYVRDTSHNNQLINLKVINAGREGIYISTSNNTVKGCDLNDNGEYGAELYNSSPGKVNNNIIEDNYIFENAKGLLVGSGSNNDVFSNIITGATAGNGILVDYAASNSNIINNTIYGGLKYGLSLGNSTNTLLENNIGFNNAWGNLSISSNSTKVTKITNSFAVDPVFNNPANGDFHLTASSPNAVKYGATVYSLNPNDFSGNPYKNSGSMSMGALQI